MIKWLTDWIDTLRWWKQFVNENRIPKRERWLYENPEALASVERGLAEASQLHQRS